MRLFTWPSYRPRLAANEDGDRGRLVADRYGPRSGVAAPCLAQPLMISLMDKQRGRTDRTDSALSGEGKQNRAAPWDATDVLSETRNKSLQWQLFPATINVEDRLLTPEYSLPCGLIHPPPPWEDIPKLFDALAPPQLATADSLYVYREAGSGSERAGQVTAGDDEEYIPLPLYTQIRGPSYQSWQSPADYRKPLADGAMALVTFILPA
ncbi:uncharacterized protein Triagg1_3209 [Trichoderma aggressivum f. europaeum]|uniref:Uncharacterized protein n=1 Tax=Trichoderma aggressivum f. europaeum TaxID=173218 RepID=A0AAE1IJF2_9HYPO|nr:hypothetical protein Triagg1_3209 [Trichoderma aggressivum f. europaeum]